MTAKWDLGMESTLLELVIHNKPIPSAEEKSIQTILQGLKDAGLDLDEEGLRLKLNEYWDLTGIERLDDEDEDHTEEQGEEKHVVIDEEKNEIVSIKDEVKVAPMTRSQMKKQREVSPEVVTPVTRRTTRRSSRVEEANTPPTEETTATTEEIKPRRGRPSRIASPTSPSRETAASTPKKRGRPAIEKSEEPVEDSVEESAEESAEESGERPKGGVRGTRTPVKKQKKKPVTPKGKTAQPQRSRSSRRK